MSTIKASIRQKQKKYDKFMDEVECYKWIENGGKINPLTGINITQQITEGSPNVLISNACAKHNLFMKNNAYIHPLSTKLYASRSPQASRSPVASSLKPASRRKAVSNRRKTGSVLSDENKYVIIILEFKFNSITEKTTYSELDAILKYLINYEEKIEGILNRVKYNEPYYGKKSCEDWVKNMKDIKYTERHIFYNINDTAKEYIIYNNINFYFKTIMYAFIYGLNLTEIPSIQNNIYANKFIELLKLLFKTYEYKNDDELKNEFKYLFYCNRYNRSDKIKNIYLEHTKIHDLTAPRFRPFKEKLTEIEYYLKNTLYVYNKTFQNSDDSKLYKENYFY